MGRVIYNVATSLDGFIAPAEETPGWIVEDPAIDFELLYSRFDRFIMGRKTYEAISSAGSYNLLKNRPKSSVFVVSRTLDAVNYPDVTIVRDSFLDLITKWRTEDATNVWVMGGGWLAGQCLETGLLDCVEAAVMPVVLRSGYKLFGNTSGEVGLILQSVRRLQESGILITVYDIKGPVKNE